MSEQKVTVKIGERISNITLNRPAVRNAIDLDMYGQLCDALMQAGSSEEVDVIVLRGEGGTFSVGEDLVELARMDAEGRLEEWQRIYRGFVQVTWLLPKMVIAGVSGEALGIGCELALLADVTFADENAKFGHPEAAIGITAPTVWPWLAGPKIAKEYLSSGRVMSASEAARVRLINRAMPADRLEEEIDALAHDFASMPPGTAVANKRVLNWAYRDISRVLVDDVVYRNEFAWLIENRSVDASFYEDVRDHGVTAALRKRNAPFAKS